jgi:hypothetical protein
VNPADAKAIELFVRSTLGCQCPDEIFSDITITHARNPDSDLTYTRLVIGNRLLIYVLDARHSSALPLEVTTLAARGRADRDTDRLNRFRLVLTSDCPDEAKASVDAAFSSASGHDDHAHLHVVGADQVPRLLAP